MQKKYEKSKIYIIKCNVTNKSYIGGTTQPLSKTLSYHKQKFKTYLNNIYLKSLPVFRTFQHDDYSIVLLESYPCKSIDELNARVHHHRSIAKINSQNINIATNRNNDSSINI
jgi:predicted GIY-YIG superfamily endonuclease